MKNYKLIWGFIFGSTGIFISSIVSFVLVFIIGMVSFAFGMGGNHEAELLWQNIAGVTMYTALFFIGVVLILAAFRGISYGKKLELENNPNVNDKRTKKWTAIVFVIWVIAIALFSMNYFFEKIKTTQLRETENTIQSAHIIDVVKLNPSTSAIDIHMMTGTGIAGTYNLNIRFKGGYPSKDYLIMNKQIHLDKNGQEIIETFPIGNIESEFSRAVNMGSGNAEMMDTSRVFVSLQLQKDDAGKLQTNLTPQKNEIEADFFVGTWRCTDGQCKIKSEIIPK